MKTEDILNEREKTHGDFEEFCELRWSLTKTLREFEIKHAKELERFKPTQIIALAAILTKLSRIVCGDPNFSDHWDDIAGYAMLGKGKEERTGEEKEDCELCKRECCTPSEHLARYVYKPKDSQEREQEDLHICR